MKKIYFLLVSFVSIFTFGQTTIFNAAGGGAYPTTGWSDTNNVTANAIDRTTYYLVDPGAPSDIILTSTYDLSTYTSAILDIDVATFGSGTANPALIEVSYDGGTTYTDSFNTTTPTSSTYVTGGPINLSTVSSQVVIRISNAGATGRGVRLRNIKLDAYGTDPDLSITAPTNATVYAPNITNVNVNLSVLNFAVANGTGDGHIVYTINNGTPVDKFDTADIAVPTTAGQSYTVDLELVDNMGVPLSTPVTATVSFSVANFTSVSNIAALRAGTQGDYYELTGEAVVTYTRPGTATRNQKYIQDATAAILIDDASETITNTFSIGQAMTGLKGRLSSFNGVLQIVPLEDITPATATFTITPEVVTIANITGDVNAYESELVQINGVTFTTGDGINTFAANANYDISDGTNMAFRSIFAEANYVVNTDLVPTGTNNLTVLVAEFNGTPQVVARSLADVTLSTNSFNVIEGLTMYPNPVVGNVLHFSSAANATMTVQIFDIVGKQVINTKVTNNTINTTNLNAGMYIVKITEEGKTATRKLVVK